MADLGGGGGVLTRDVPLQCLFTYLHQINLRARLSALVLVQGYNAHKKPAPARTLQQACA